MRSMGGWNQPKTLCMRVHVITYRLERLNVMASSDSEDLAACSAAGARSRGCVLDDKAWEEGQNMTVSRADAIVERE